MESPADSTIGVGPSETYLNQCSIPSVLLEPEQYQKQLLILDLNGTLLARSNKTYHTRPHFEKFFDYIFERFIVMVWSSATEKSVKTMCRVFSKGNHDLTYKWDRSHLELTEDEFYKNVETIKDLECVWKSIPQFNSTNTIIIDDSPGKLSYQPHNLVPVNTFDLSMTWGRNHDFVLLKLINYLKMLELQSNVTNYIKAHPFDTDLSWDVELDKIDSYTVTSFTKSSQFKDRLINITEAKLRRQKKIAKKARQRLNKKERKKATLLLNTSLDNKEQ